MQKKPRIGLFLTCMLLAAAVLAPWKQLAEWQLRAMLERQGLQSVSFVLEELSFSGLVLKDISLGGAFPFMLDRLRVDYSLGDLLQKNINQIRADTLVLEQGGITLALQGARVVFDAPQGHKRQASWSVDSIVAEESPWPLPPLSGKGSALLDGAHAQVSGQLKSADASHEMTFSVNYFSDASQRSELSIASLMLPWGGGTLSTRDAAIPLAENGVSKIRLRIERVQLETLMDLLTQGRAHATGVVSGTVPVVFKSGEPVVVENGELKTEAPGTLTLEPGAIPAGNEQLNLLNQMLSGFYYERLSMQLSSNSSKKLSVLISLLGRNPDFQEGRTVKLNVNLTGDVLETLQQSVLPLTDPKQLLKQDK